MVQSLLELGSEKAISTADSCTLHRVNLAYERFVQILNTPKKGKVYGLHTGYGADVSSERKESNWHQNQMDLLCYLCVGVGDPFENSVTRRALRLQAQKTGQGYSGVHPKTFERLVNFSNQPKLPLVPKYGSLGASGDLIPMAHAVSPIFEGITSQDMGPRDVLSLVNTNAFMSSYALELLEKAECLLESTLQATAYTSLGLGVLDEPFSATGLGVNSHQAHIVEAGSRILEARSSAGKMPERATDKFPVQERYSVRCAPQILGNCLLQLRFAEERICAEAEAVADNPLVLTSNHEKNPSQPQQEIEAYMWHGGHFYTAGLASAADMLLDVVGRCSELLDRQVLLLMHPSTNHGLPENLQWGRALHVKGIHQLVSALQQQIRSLAMPSRLLSFSAEGNNQDVLPCSMAALHNVAASLKIGFEITRAASFVGQRAVELRKGEDLSRELWLSNWGSFQIKT
jgi:histidine ammonia-lyase